MASPIAASAAATVRMNSANTWPVRSPEWVENATRLMLTAMVGAIVLTLRHKEGVKRQNIAEQVARTPATAVELRKVASRAGI